MLIICYGMPKSASSFYFQMVKDLVEHAGFEQMSLKKRYMPSKWQCDFTEITGVDALDMSALIPDNCWILYKTHSAFTPEVSSLLTDKKALAIASYRNPIDCMVSLMDTSLSEALLPLEVQRDAFLSIKNDPVIASWFVSIGVKDADRWLSCDLVFPVAYEGLTSDPYGFLSDIASFFKLAVKKSIINSIVDAYLVDKSKVWEFNIGGTNRYEGRLTDKEINDAYSMFKFFFKKYNINFSYTPTD